MGADTMLRKVKDIEYRLLPGTSRQTTDIVIERDGLITVRPPARMTPEQVDDTVLSRRLWIYRNLAEWRDLNSTRVVREWVSGESFLYLGNAYRLLLVAEQDEPVKLKDGRFCLLRSVIDHGGKAAAQDAFRDFYFHWKCLMAPPKIIDYIVVHELCHMRHRDHTDLFWNEVDKVMPDYRERKEWLRQRGAAMEI
jgi:predicted metal-dependent hydrolase